MAEVVAAGWKYAGQRESALSDLAWKSSLSAWRGNWGEQGEKELRCLCVCVCACVKVNEFPIEY